jgi:CheY-like chemotaxis protein
VGEAEKAKAWEFDGTETQSLSRGVILHVEDDDDLRRTTGKLLESAGYEFRGVSTPDAAIAEATAWRQHLDVLVVDFHLGARQTGTEVAEAVARLLGRGLPTVILTGDPTNAEVPWLRNSPVWLIRKPFCANTLLAGLPPLVAFSRAMRREERRA